MSEEDFRALMADLEAAETERDILREMLTAERVSQNEYMDQVESLRKSFEIERLALKNSVDSQRRQKILWGVLGLGLGAAFVN